MPCLSLELEDIRKLDSQMQAELHAPESLRSEIADRFGEGKPVVSNESQGDIWYEI